MTLTIRHEALNPEAVLTALVKQNARAVVASVADLTDNSAGSAGDVVALSVALTNAANAATNLAQKAATEAALTTVKDALAEIYAKANAYAVKLGLDQVTYNGGGAAADGTIAAVTVAVTAAATGVQAASMNANLAALNTAFYNASILVNKIAKATGYDGVDTFVDSRETTIAALAVDGGTAADPGVTKAAVDAELVKAANNVATLAAKLNEVNAGLGNALVVAQ